MSKPMSLLCAAAAVAAAGSCTGPDIVQRSGFVVQCQVEKQECASIKDGSGTCTVVGEDHHTFLGDVCFSGAGGSAAQDACNARFCPPGGGFGAPGFCQTTVLAAGAAMRGECGGGVIVDPTYDNVTGTFHWLQCDSDNFDGVCTYTVHDEPFQTCIDVSMMSALDQLKPPYNVAGAAHITNIEPLFFCGSNAPATAFELTPGPIATASGGGTTTSVTALRGRASVGKTCFGEICVLKSLDSLRLDVADTTVAGLPVTGVSISNVRPAPLTSIPNPSGGGTFLGVASGGLWLRLTGNINGVLNTFVLTNDSPWRVDAATPSFRLAGSLALDRLGPGGGSLPVSVTADARGVPATAQSQACASFTTQQLLFGFEDVQRWSSTQATLSLATTPLTQGCGALGVQGQGYMSITGAGFTTRGLATNAATSVDLFIPGNQPNPGWLGALQMYLSCPSGNVFNQYIGQVELTGKPQNQYSTLRFPLPSAVRTTLAQPLDDCSFSFGLNVNQTGQRWLLDNLRFTP